MGRIYRILRDKHFAVTDPESVVTDRLLLVICFFGVRNRTAYKDIDGSLPGAAGSLTAGLASCGFGHAVLSGHTPRWWAPQSHADGAPHRCAVLVRCTERRTRTAHLYNTQVSAVTGRRTNCQQWNEHFTSTYKYNVTLHLMIFGRFQFEFGHLD